MGKKSSAARSAANAECRMQNAELEGDGVNAECRMQNAELESDDANAECGTLNAELENDDVNAELESEPSEDNSEFRIPNSELEKALAAEKDRYLRLAAEYDNFRRRSVKERETTYRDARHDAIARLLPVYDNLERALKMECSDEAFYKGIEMTMTGLIDILDSMEVKQIPAVGEPFDPNRHNAVMATENPELGEKIVAKSSKKDSS